MDAALTVNQTPWLVGFDSRSPLHSVSWERNVMKRTTKKLALNRETVRRLGTDELRKAAAGTCWSATSDCGEPLCPDDQGSANGCVTGNLC